LHLEHIIPGAIGGTFKFPNASCRECGEKTGAIEGRVIARLYGDSRAYMGLRRGNRRKWEKTHIHIKRGEPPSVGNRIDVHEDISDFERIEVPADDHPSPFISINLKPAAIFVRGALKDNSPFRQESMNIAGPPDMIERVRRIGKGRIVFGGGHGVRMTHDHFGRFLAKIAHSFAAATLGVGSFIPTLTKAIRGEEPMNLSYYVGCAMAGLVPVEPTQHLHSLECGRATLNGKEMVIVRVRLFAVDGFPAYDVIVGEVTRATPL